jgi:hypothetical protein
MQTTIAIIHWILNTGVVLFLWLLVIFTLAYALKLCWQPYQRRKHFMLGHKSITDQFDIAPGEVLELTAPEPPATWNAEKQVLYRSGQLKALAVLKAHNAKVQEALKRGRKRSSAGVAKPRP